MLQHRAVKKLRKMVESEVFFPFLPRHREHFMIALYFNTMVSKLFTSASESFVGTVFLERIVSESRWFLLSIRFQTIIVSTNIM